LAAYNHSDLDSTFSEIDNRLQALLGKVISAQNFVYVPLEKKTENIYTGNIQDESLFTIGKFFLAITSDDVPQADVIKFVPAKLKISSADTINDILNAAMPGVGISHLHVPPSALPIKVGYEYFRLESSGELWAMIKESKNIAIYVPKDLVAIELKLIILKGQ
jgi:type VI secretion system protein ImpJ